MSKILITGNGFDLAHGLPTSYKDFIDDFWKNFKVECKSRKYLELLIVNDLYDGYYTGYEPICNFNNFKSNLKKYSKETGLKLDMNDFACSNNKHTVFAFRSNFFLLVNKKNTDNWIDIENEYYRELKKIVKSTQLTIEDKKQQAFLLNKEFDHVKNLLEIYLKEKIEKQYDFRLYTDNSIKNILLPELSHPFKESHYLKEFHHRDQSYIKNFLYENKEKFSLNTHFLSFNYTQVVEQYFNGFAYQKQLNYIHGKLYDNLNQVNFGFGDEMDDDYKLIENIDDNEYLKNFKSFQYLQNPNYQNLLDFVETKKFQVYVMGHSCGLSDRTMLNTVFEHPNCISIKVFYHQKPDGLDNYTEIIQNISRHFNKKALMREKIVNKTLCQPLPQIPLPKK